MGFNLPNLKILLCFAVIFFTCLTTIYADPTLSISQSLDCGDSWSIYCSIQLSITAGTPNPFIIGAAIDVKLNSPSDVSAPLRLASFTCPTPSVSTPQSAPFVYTWLYLSTFTPPTPSFSDQFQSCTLIFYKGFQSYTPTLQSTTVPYTFEVTYTPPSICHTTDGNPLSRFCQPVCTNEQIIADPNRLDCVMDCYHNPQQTSCKQMCPITTLSERTYQPCIPWCYGTRTTGCIAPLSTQPTAIEWCLPPPCVEDPSFTKDDLGICCAPGDRTPATNGFCPCADSSQSPDKFGVCCVPSAIENGYCPCLLGGSQTPHPTNKRDLLGQCCPYLQMTNKTCPGECPSGQSVDTYGKCCNSVNKIDGICPPVCAKSTLVTTNGSICCPPDQVSGSLCNTCPTTDHVRDKAGKCCLPSNFSGGFCACSGSNVHDIEGECCSSSLIVESYCPCPAGGRRDNNKTCCADIQMSNNYCPCTNPAQVRAIDGACCASVDLFGNQCQTPCGTGSTRDSENKCCASPTTILGKLYCPCASGGVRDSAAACCQPSDIFGNPGLCKICAQGLKRDVQGRCCAAVQTINNKEYCPCEDPSLVRDQAAQCCSSLENGFCPCVDQSLHPDSTGVCCLYTQWIITQPSPKIIACPSSCTNPAQTRDKFNQCCADVEKIGGTCKCSGADFVISQPDQSGGCCDNSGGTCATCLNSSFVRDPSGRCCAPTSYDNGYCICSDGLVHDSFFQCCAASNLQTFSNGKTFCPCSTPNQFRSLTGQCCSYISMTEQNCPAPCTDSKLLDKYGKCCISSDLTNGVCNVPSACTQGFTLDKQGTCCDDSLKVGDICGACPANQVRDKASTCCLPSQFSSGFCKCGSGQEHDGAGLCCPSTPRSNGFCPCSDTNLTRDINAKCCLSTQQSGNICPLPCPNPSHQHDISGNCCLVTQLDQTQHCKQCTNGLTLSIDGACCLASQMTNQQCPAPCTGSNQMDTVGHCCLPTQLINNLCPGACPNNTEIRDKWSNCCATLSGSNECACADSAQSRDLSGKCCLATQMTSQICPVPCTGSNVMDTTGQCCLTTQMTNNLCPAACPANQVHDKWANCCISGDLNNDECPCGKKDAWNNCCPQFVPGQNYCSCQTPSDIRDPAGQCCVAPAGGSAYCACTDPTLTLATDGKCCLSTQMTNNLCPGPCPDPGNVRDKWANCCQTPSASNNECVCGKTDAWNNCCPQFVSGKDYCPCTTVSDFRDSTGQCCPTLSSENNQFCPCADSAQFRDLSGKCCLSTQMTSQTCPAPCTGSNVMDTTGQCCLTTQMTNNLCPAACPANQVHDKWANCCISGDLINDECPCGKTDALAHCCAQFAPGTNFCPCADPLRVPDTAGKCCTPTQLNGGSTCPTCADPSQVMDNTNKCCLVGDLDVGGLCPSPFAIQTFQPVETNFYYDENGHIRYPSQRPIDASRFSTLACSKVCATLGETGCLQPCTRSLTSGPCVPLCGTGVTQGCIPQCGSIGDEQPSINCFKLPASSPAAGFKSFSLTVPTVASASFNPWVTSGTNPTTCSPMSASSIPDQNCVLSFKFFLLPDDGQYSSQSFQIQGLPSEFNPASTLNCAFTPVTPVYSLRVSLVGTAIDFSLIVNDGQTAELINKRRVYTVNCATTAQQFRYIHTQAPAGSSIFPTFPVNGRQLVPISPSTFYSFQWPAIPPTWNYLYDPLTCGASTSPICLITVTASATSLSQNAYFNSIKFSSNWLDLTTAISTYTPSHPTVTGLILGITAESGAFTFRFTLEQAQVTLPVGYSIKFTRNKKISSAATQADLSAVIRKAANISYGTPSQITNFHSPATSISLADQLAIPRVIISSQGADCSLITASTCTLTFVPLFTGTITLSLPTVPVGTPQEMFFISTQTTTSMTYNTVSSVPFFVRLVANVKTIAAAGSSPLTPKTLAVRPTSISIPAQALSNVAIADIFLPYSNLFDVEGYKAIFDATSCNSYYNPYCIIAVNQIASSTQSTSFDLPQGALAFSILNQAEQTDPVVYLTSLPTGLTLPSASPICGSSTSDAYYIALDAGIRRYYAMGNTQSDTCYIVFLKPRRQSTYPIFAFNFYSYASTSPTPIVTANLGFSVFTTSGMTVTSSTPIPITSVPTSTSQAHPCLRFYTNAELAALNPPLQCQLRSTLSSAGFGQRAALTGKSFQSKPITTSTNVVNYLTALNGAKCSANGIDYYTFVTSLNPSPSVTITFGDLTALLDTTTPPPCFITMPESATSVDLFALSVSFGFNGYSVAIPDFILPLPPRFLQMPLTTSSQLSETSGIDYLASYILDINPNSWTLWTSARTSLVSQGAQREFPCIASTSAGDVTVLKLVANNVNTQLIKIATSLTAQTLHCTIIFPLDYFTVSALTSATWAFESYGYVTGLSPYILNEANIPANFPILTSQFSVTPSSICVGVYYCLLQFQFGQVYDSLQLKGNHFDLPLGSSFTCRETVQSVVLANIHVELDSAQKFTTFVTLQQVSTENPADPAETRSILSNYINPQSTVSFIRCIISLPVPSTLSQSQREVDFTIQPSSDPNAIFKVDLPAVSRDPVVSLVPNVCHTNGSCVYEFHFGSSFLSEYPLLQFSPQFAGTWTPLNSPYCHMKQSSSVVIQITQNIIYSTDTIASCSFLVSPLQSNYDGSRAALGRSAGGQISLKIRFPITPPTPEWINTFVNSHSPINWEDSTQYTETGLNDFILNDVIVFPNVLNFVKPTISPQTFLIGNSDSARIDVPTSPMAIQSTDDPSNLMTGSVSIQIAACIGVSSCSVNYAISVPNIIRTIRFQNHFKLTDPRRSLPCLSSDDIIGNLFVSPTLEYVYLRSTNSAGFTSQTCTISYPIVDTSAAQSLPHSFEIVGNPLNTDDPITSHYTDETMSEPTTYPSFSPLSATILNSYIQEHSAQNYITIQINSADNVTPIPIQFTKLQIKFTQLELLKNKYGFASPANPDLSTPIYDINQMECGIPPSSDSPIQSSCRASPTPDGIEIIFELATSESVKYIWMAWTMGAISGPWSLPEVVSSITLSYEPINYVAYQSPSKSLIPFNIFAFMPSSPSQFLFDSLIAVNTLYQGPRILPVMLDTSWDDASVTLATTSDQTNFYLGSGNSAIRFKLRLGSIPLGSEIILQMVYLLASGVRQPVSIELNLEDTSGVPPISKIPSTVTCIHCRVFKVDKADLGILTFQLTYTDSYNTFSQVNNKSFLRMAIKTYLDLRMDDTVRLIPSRLSGVSGDYSPELTTVYNYKFAPWFILIDYRLQQPAYLSRSSVALQASLSNTPLLLRISPLAQISTLPISSPFYDGIQDLQHQYDFTCPGWKLDLTSPLLTATLPDETTKLLVCSSDQNSGLITCTSAYPTTTFPFLSPDLAFPRSRCDVMVTISGRTIVNKNLQVYDSFDWTFNLHTVFPPVVPPQRLIFPRFALPCSSTVEFFLVTGGPGVYSVTPPDGFSIGDLPGSSSQPTLFTVKNRAKTASLTLPVVDITVGLSNVIYTSQLINVAIPLTIPITCPDDNRSIEGVAWSYSFTPFASMRNILSVADQPLTHPLGYFVNSPHGIISPTAFVLLPLDTSPQVDPTFQKPYTVLVSSLTSIKKATSVLIAPLVKYPVLGLFREFDQQPFIFTTYQLVFNPTTRKFVSELVQRTIFLTASTSKTDDSGIVLTFSEDLEMYSPTVQFEYPDDASSISLQPGSFFGLALLGTYDNLFILSQCASTVCSEIVQFPLVIDSPLKFSLAFHGQYLQPIESSLSINRDLSVNDSLEITIPPNSDFYFQPDPEQLYNLYTVQITEYSIQFTIGRFISVNEPLTFKTAMIRKIDDGTLFHDYNINFSVSSSVYSVSQTSSAADSLPETGHEDIPIEFSSHFPIHSFSIPIGYHANSAVRFQLALGREFSFGQSFLVKDIPIFASIPSPLITTIEGYRFLLSSQPNPDRTNYGALQVESATSQPIPSGTIFTIEFSAPNVEPSMIDLITFSSEGLGTPAYPINELVVASNVQVFRGFASTISSLGPPRTSAGQLDTTIPSTTNSNRSPPLACLPEQLCFIHYDVETLDPQLDSSVIRGRLVIRPIGLFVRLYFDNKGGLFTDDETDPSYELSSDLTEHNIPFSNPEIYKNQAGVAAYSVSRTYYSNYIELFVKPTESQPTELTGLDIPVKFTQSQLHGFVQVRFYDVDASIISISPQSTAFPFYSAITPAPSVWPVETDFRPSFFYVGGGLYVGEQIQLGIIPNTLLIQTGLPQTQDERLAIGLQAPTPRYFVAQHSYPTAAPPPTLPPFQIGFTYRSFISPFDQQSQTSFAGTGILSTTTTPNALSITYFNLNPTSPTDSLVTTYPIAFNKAWDFDADGGKFVFSSYSNLAATAFGSSFQTDERYLIARFSAGHGMKVRLTPWIRVTPNLHTISFNTLQSVTLSLKQQFPNHPTTNQPCRLQSTDSVQVHIPTYFTVNTGSYPCRTADNLATTALLEWNGEFFTFHLSDVSQGSSADAATLDEYLCTITTFVNKETFNTYTSAYSALKYSPEITLSTVQFTAPLGHLPTTSSAELSPYNSDSASTDDVETLYLQWFMPMPVEKPTYKLTFENINIVGIPGRLHFSLTNTFLSTGHTLTIANDKFPVGVDTEPTKIGTSCQDNFGSDIARVIFDTNSGLRLQFVNAVAIQQIDCWFTFTAKTSLRHNGAILRIPASVSNDINNAIVVDVEFLSPGSPSRPLAIRVPQSTVSLQATLIKGIASQLIVSGSEFSVNPDSTELDGTKAETSLSISTGAYFISVNPDQLTNVEGLTCVTNSNVPFADVYFTFLGQVTSSSQPLLPPAEISPDDTTQYASSEGQTGTAFRFTLKFRYPIDLQSQWSCSFHIITAADYSGRSPDATFRVGRSSSSIVVLDRLIFKPVVEVDLGITQADAASKVMSHFTFYYNSTVIDQPNRRSPPNVQISLPTSLATFPFDGCQCYLNNQRYMRLPLFTRSISSFTSQYYIPLERYLAPTGSLLNRIFCIVANLSTRTSENQSSSRFQYGSDIINQHFETTNAPKFSIYEKAFPQNYFAEDPVVQRASYGKIVNPGATINLVAYSASDVSFNVTNFNSVQFANIYPSNPALLQITTSGVCSEIPSTNPFETPVFYESMYGLIALRSLSAVSCFTQITAAPSGYTTPPVVPSGKKCSPFFSLWPTATKLISRDGSVEYTGGTCFRTSPIFYALPNDFYQAYTLTIQHVPILRATDRSFRPVNIGTPGYIDYEYSGYHDSTFVVWMTTDGHRTSESVGDAPFSAQITMLDSAGSITGFGAFNHQSLLIAPMNIVIPTPYGCTVEYYPSNVVFTPPSSISFTPESLTDIPKTGVLFKCPTTSRFDKLSSMRIAYNTREGYDQTITIRTWIVPNVIPNPPVDYPLLDASTYLPQDLFTLDFATLPTEYKLITYTTNHMTPLTPEQSPSSFPTIKLSPLNSSSAIPRGKTTIFSLQMTNVSPMTDTILGVSWLSWTHATNPYAFVDPKFDKTDYHFSSPYGSSVLTGLPPSIIAAMPSLDGALTVNSACFDYAFSSTMPLVGVAILNVGPRVAVIYKIYGEALGRYYASQNERTDFFTCQFPLSFVAETFISYQLGVENMFVTTSPAMEANKVYSVPIMATPTPAHIFYPYQGFRMAGSPQAAPALNLVQVEYPELNIDSQFDSTVGNFAILDTAAVTISDFGYITFSIAGTQLTAGNVIVIKFVTDPALANETISNPLEQPYRFYSATAATATSSCYNLFYPSQIEAVGSFTAVSSSTFRPIVGGASNTFALTITKGSSGIYPEFLCKAPIATMSTIPFTGYTLLQTYSERQYAILTGSLQPPAVSSPFVSDCTIPLPSIDYVNFCPSLAGGLTSGIKVGVDVVVDADDIVAPLTPLSITFYIGIHPSATDVIVTADFSAVQLSTFYGCDGFPGASFYGDIGSPAESSILTIPIDYISSQDAVVTCHFLSSRYIQPSYYLSEDGTTVRILTTTDILNRPGLIIPLVITAPDQFRSGQRVTLKESSFLFKSTFVQPTSVISLSLTLDRIDLLANSGKFISDPYLQSNDRTTLIQWIRDTTAVSLFPLSDSSPLALFSYFTDNQIFVLNQELNLADHTLTVVIGFLSQSIVVDTESIYIFPFPSFQAWILKAQTLGLPFSPRSFPADAASLPVKHDKYVQLTSILAQSGHFEQCLTGTCGGSCEPCPLDYSCFNNFDCRTGLFCYYSVDGNVIATLVPGDYSTIAIKIGIFDPPGTCKPLGFGSTKNQNGVTQFVMYPNHASIQSLTYLLCLTLVSLFFAF